MPGEPKSKESQLEWLLEKFTGHEAFHRVRGRLQGPTINFIVGNNSKDGSRRASQEQFRRFTDDLVLIQSVVAQFERDGWAYALEQLRLALTVPGYLFPEEVVPIDQSTNVTMYLPKFTQSLTVMRWVKKHGGCEDQKQITAEDFQELYAVLPSLEEIYDERSRDFGKTITQYDVSLRLAGQKDLEPPKRPHIKQSEYNRFVGLISDIFFGVSYYGWLISQNWQKDFLGQLSRSYQKTLTAWHFKMPTAALGKKLHHFGEWIGAGVHPAEEHSKWQKLYPSLTSQETSDGYGIILWPYPYEKELEDYPKDNFLLRCY